MSSGPLSFSGVSTLGIELDRAQVDVLVQLEAQPQQDALLQDARLHVRVADGAQVDGVEAAQLLHGASGRISPVRR